MVQTLEREHPELSIDGEYLIIKRHANGVTFTAHYRVSGEILGFLKVSERKGNLSS